MHKAPIPVKAEWPLRLMKDVTVKIGSGATPTGGQEAYLDNRINFSLVRSQNVFDRHFDYSGLAYISNDQSDKLRGVFLKDGDVLLNITGDGITFGRSCRVPHELLPACVNQHVSIIRPNTDILDSDFLLSYLTHPGIKSYIESFNAGGSRRAITKGHIESFVVPVPPMSEQMEIGSLLSALDDKIELNRRMNETLEAMARAIFKDWFVDFGPTRAKMEGRAPYLAPGIWSLFPERLDYEGKPEGWVFGTLGDVAQQVGESVQPAALDPGTPYIGLEHMPRKSIALSEWDGAGKVTSGKLSFRKGDFLFGKLRPYFHKVGVAPVDGICSTDIVVMNAREPNAAAFVLACISQDEFVAFTDRTSDGTKMPRTSWGRMERYDLCLPSGSALEAFKACVEPMLDRIVSNIHESHALAEMRVLLLPKLMSGEVRVKDAGKLVGGAV